MNRLEQFIRANPDHVDRIALAYEQQKFWHDKRRAHQMKHGYLTACMYEGTLYARGLITAKEFRRRVLFAVQQMRQQRGDRIAKPVLP